jgi:hypothetical protein
LLKHLVWLLSVLGTLKDLEPKCVELVCRLTDLDWKPRERAQKVMIAAALYLRSFPPEVSRAALERLAQWSSRAPDGTTGNKIRDVLLSYYRDRRLKS